MNLSTTKSFYKGALYTLFSATGLAFTGLLGQTALKGMSLNAVIFWRFLASFLICYFLLALMRQLSGILSFSNFKMHLLRAFFVLLSQYSFYYYLERNTLFNALVLLNTGPLFTPMIERWILGHHVGPSTWAGVFVSLVGIVCVLQPDVSVFSWMSLIGLTAGVSQACSQVVFGINSKTERTDLSVLYLFFICTVMSLIFYLLEGHYEMPFGIEKDMLLILGLGAASTCNQITRAEGYKHGTPSALGVFLYFSILLGAIFDWAISGLVPNTLSAIGGFLVVLGGFLKIYLRHRAINK